MQGHLSDGVVEIGANGRERYYDSRGYGRPRGDGVVLSRVEAAHLLYRGDLGTVDGLDFSSFLGENEEIVVPFVVYTDLRERGFYLSPARPDWVDRPEGADFVVHPRGEGPWDGLVEHRVRVVGERESLHPDTLGDVVLAVVDEESEITYLETGVPDPGGSNEPVVAGSFHGDRFDDRILCWDPPSAIYDIEFFGQRLGPTGEPLQLSLLEAVHLADTGRLSIDGGVKALVNRGRALEGARFDRRLATYRELRKRGLVPKTGFKFGADFRTYAAVESVDSLGHSESLVRVLPTDVVLSPRDLALDVRLAHGVRKQMVYALVENTASEEADKSAKIRWRSIARLTP